MVTGCSDFYRSLFIADMYYIPNTYKHKLTNSILKQKKFSRIIKLDVQYNENISDISFLTNLKKLNAWYPVVMTTSKIYHL